MEELAPGFGLDAAGCRVPGTRTGAPVEIVERIAELPHGDLYRARLDGIPVLATVLDPANLEADTIAWIGESIQRAASVSHRNLLAMHGLAGGDRHWAVVQGHPDGKQARQLVAERAARGRTVELETARTMIGHLCNALQVLHTVTTHGWVGADTVWISASGRVLLADAGLGPLVVRSHRFARLRAAGRLPGIAPEQLHGGELGPGTDVFGLAALFLELVTGRPLPEAGAPMQSVGLCGPPDLLLCLERATAPDPMARPPDAATFKAELAEALAGGATLDLRAPTSARREAPASASSGARPPAPLVLPPLAAHRPTRDPGSTTSPTTEHPIPRAPSPLAAPRSGARPTGPAPTPAQGRPTQAQPQGLPTHAVPSAMPAQGMPIVPGTTMPVMLPSGMPAMGVMGAPMPGPAGFPAIVPVFVGVPPPAAAPAPSGTATRVPSPDASMLRELDLATRRITEAGLAEAAFELTEEVGATAARLHGPAPAPTSATPRIDRLDVGDAAPPRTSTSMSAAASPRTSHSAAAPPRTSTSTSAATPRHDHGPAPSRGGTSTGTPIVVDRRPTPVPRGTPRAVAATPTPLPRTTATPRAGIAIDDEDRERPESSAASYLWQHPGAAPTEHTLAELAVMARAGRIAHDDVLVHVQSQRRLRVVDIAPLRNALGERGPAVPDGPRLPVPTIPVAPMRIESRGAAKALWWILLVVAVLGGAGVFLWSLFG